MQKIRFPGIVLANYASGVCNYRHIEVLEGTKIPYDDPVYAHGKDLFKYG
jgi:hypothetical protein